MKSKVAASFIAVMVVVSLAFVASSGASTARVVTGRTVFPGTINVAFKVASAVQDYPLYLAKDYGIFARYGLNVNVEVVSPTAIDAAFESGAIEFAIGTAPGFELDYQAGGSIKMIGMDAEHSTAWLAVRPDIKTIGDLAGKPVGTSTPDGSPTIQIKYALHSANVPVNSVTYVPVTTAAAVGALVSGEVDAASFNFQELQQAEAALPGIHSLYNFVHMVLPSGSLWGFTPFMSTHKAETAAFLRAFNAAIVKWNSDKTLAYHEIAIYSDTTSQSTISQSYVSAASVLNRGPNPVHLPSTKIEAFINRILRLIGYPTAYNHYADENQEWTPVYWDAAFETR